MNPDDILERTPPAADARLAYGNDPNQFGDLRLPKTGKSFPVIVNIHGGYWRAKYDLLHAGHMCAALTQDGYATWNLEYRRVGNPGGAWPGTFEDLVNGYRFVSQVAHRYRLDPSRMLVMGHSAGGQLALCLAAHEQSVTRAISLAGVLDLQSAYRLHLSNDAVVEFLGGTPTSVPEHYHEADPMQLKVTARQVVVQGAADDVVPPSFSRLYAAAKEKRGENVRLVEIAKAGHFDLIDPQSGACQQVRDAARELLAR
jgi:acetyl esterase/lipase